MAKCKHSNISGWGPWMPEGTNSKGQTTSTRTKHCLDCGDTRAVEVKSD